MKEATFLSDLPSFYHIAVSNQSLARFMGIIPIYKGTRKRPQNNIAMPMIIIIIPLLYSPPYIWPRPKKVKLSDVEMYLLFT
jgi:hypothetical protein